MIFSLIARVDSSVVVNIVNTSLTHLRINFSELKHRISRNRLRDPISRILVLFSRLRSFISNKIIHYTLLLATISTVFQRNEILQTPPLSRQNTLLSNIVTDDNVFIRSQLRLFSELVTREFHVEDRNKIKKKRKKKNVWNVRCVKIHEIVSPWNMRTFCDRLFVRLNSRWNARRFY